jgi:hypothetical protein
MARALEMNARLNGYLGIAAYGLAVFVGVAVFGFVVAPVLAIASGLFAIEAEARGFVSLLTLRAVPYFAALSAVSGVLHPALSGRRASLRVALYGLNVVLVWLVAGAIALAILG